MSSSTNTNTMAGGAASPTPDQHGPQLKIAGHVLGASASATDPPCLRSLHESGLKGATEVDAKVADGIIGGKDCSAESNVASTGPPAVPSLDSVVAQSDMLTIKDGEIAFNGRQVRNETWHKPDRQIKHRRLLAELDPQKRHQEVFALFRILFEAANTAHKNSVKTSGEDKIHFIFNASEIVTLVQQCTDQLPVDSYDIKEDKGGSSVYLSQVFEQCYMLQVATEYPADDNYGWTAIICSEFQDIIIAKKKKAASKHPGRPKALPRSLKKRAMVDGGTVPSVPVPSISPTNGSETPIDSGEPEPKKKDMVPKQTPEPTPNKDSPSLSSATDRVSNAAGHAQMMNTGDDVTNIIRKCEATASTTIKNDVAESTPVDNGDSKETTNSLSSKTSSTSQNSTSPSARGPKAAQSTSVPVLYPFKGDGDSDKDGDEKKKRAERKQLLDDFRALRKANRNTLSTIFADLDNKLRNTGVHQIHWLNKSAGKLAQQFDEQIYDQAIKDCAGTTGGRQQLYEDDMKYWLEKLRLIQSDSRSWNYYPKWRQFLHDQLDYPALALFSFPSAVQTGNTSALPASSNPPQQALTKSEPSGGLSFGDLLPKPTPSLNNKKPAAPGLSSNLQDVKMELEVPENLPKAQVEDAKPADVFKMQTGPSIFSGKNFDFIPPPTASSAPAKQNEDVKAPIADVKPAATPTPALEDKRQTAPEPTANGRDGKTESDASDRVPKAQVEDAKPEDVQKTDIAKLVQEMVQSQLKSMTEHFAKEKSGQDMKIDMITKRLVKHETENEKQKKELDTLKDRFVQMENQHAKEKCEQEQKIADMTQLHMKENQERDQKLAQILKLVKEKAELEPVCSTGVQTESKEPKVQQKPPTAAPNAPKALAKPEIVKTPPKPDAKGTPEDAMPTKKASPPAADLASTTSKAAKSVQKYQLKLKKPAPVQAPRIVISSPSPIKDESTALITTADSAKAVKSANPYAERVAAHPPMASFSSYRISAPAEPSRKLPTWTLPLTRQQHSSFYYSDIVIVNYAGVVQWEVPMHSDLDKFIAGWNDYLRRLPSSIVSVEDRCIIMKAMKQCVYFGYNWRVVSGMCADKILEALDKEKTKAEKEGGEEDMDAFIRAGHEVYAQVAAYFAEPFSKSSSTTAASIARLGEVCKALQAVMHNAPSAKEQQEINRCLSILRQKKDDTKTELAAVDKKFGLFDRWLVGGMGAKYEKEKLGKELGRLDTECCTHINAYYTKYEAHMNNLYALRQELVDPDQADEVWDAYEQSERAKRDASIGHMVEIAGVVGRWRV